MKLQIKIMIAAAAAVAMTAAGCSGAGEGKTDAGAEAVKAEIPDVDMRGQWLIENIVFNDSDYVRPDEVTPGVSQYIVFEDSTYFIRTNCNFISGSYAVRGDSISLGDGMMTEMACDNMAAEDALRRILPDISTLDVENDSVVRLNGITPAECILLRKAKTEIK